MKYRWFPGYAVVVTAEGAKILDADVQSRFNVYFDAIAGRFDGQREFNKQGIKYCVIGYFKLKSDAELALKYTKTKFCQFMFDLAKVAQFDPFDTHIISENSRPPYFWRHDERAIGGAR